MTRWLVIALMFCWVDPLQAQQKGKKKAAEPQAKTHVSEPDNEGEDQDIPRVVPVFDPGSHTRLIRALGFSGDKQRLITVGEDSSIQIWSATTGERLDILRLPSYGHEQGYGVPVWSTAAVSPDGNFVAVGGGQQKGLSTEDKSARARLLLIDIAKRTVHPLAGFRRSVTALAFADDNRLAVASFGDRAGKEITIFPSIVTRLRGRRQEESAVLLLKDVREPVDLLQFSADGNRLCASTDRSTFTWDLSGEKPSEATLLDSPGVISAIAWSPDGTRLLRGWWNYAGKPHGIELRRPNGELIWEHQFTDDDVFGKKRCVRSITFTSPQTALLTTDVRSGDGGNGVTPITFDLEKRVGKLLRTEPEVNRFALIGAATHDAELGAITTSAGLDAIIYRVRDGSEVARCGAASPVPTVVGWAMNSPTVAWSETRQPGRFNTRADALEIGFDLKEMQLVEVGDTRAFGVSQMAMGNWSLRHNAINSLSLLNGETVAGEVVGGNGITAATLIPRADALPWFAWGQRREQQSQTIVHVSRENGTTATLLKPAAMFVRDLAPSPNGRLLLVSTGSHRLCLYAIEGDSFPLLSLARVNGEWVAWSGNGYFTASPGGEKMFGWAESHGPLQLATFHPAEKFAKQFRRPDLLSRAIELGSMEAALKKIEVRSPSIEEILPPTCVLEKVKQVGNRVEVRAVAKSNINDKPVVSMRLLLDGRPLAGGVGQMTVAVGKPAEATWEIEAPAGSHELKLLARNEDSSSVSAPLIVTGPKTHQPVLYRLCVGVNEYQLSALNLGSAVNDARDVFTALEQHCVGPNNRFGAAKGTLLTDKQATRASVLKAIGDIQKIAKPGDLVVFLFAGHGIKQQDEFYLMTHEADPASSLKGRSLSGEDLRTALAEMQCPVLLLMDACHSARGVKSFRPATDDLTRTLTDDTAGVTILAAAMAHEVASATQENGHFTAALLKALQLGKGIPFDPHEHVLYTHHIYSVVFSEVRKATNGKQNPFLNMPWTVPPIALRDVPEN